MFATHISAAANTQHRQVINIDDLFLLTAIPETNRSRP
jgi:hypothetical protein